jgi:hypothetical protein
MRFNKCELMSDENVSRLFSLYFDFLQFIQGKTVLFYCAIYPLLSLRVIELYT